MGEIGYHHYACDPTEEVSFLCIKCFHLIARGNGILMNISDAAKFHQCLMSKYGIVCCIIHPLKWCVILNEGFPLPPLVNMTVCG